MKDDEDAKHWVQEKWFGVSISVIGVLILCVAGMSYTQLVKVDERLEIVSNTMLQFTKEFTQQLSDMRYNQLAGGMKTIQELEQLKSADMLLKKEIEDLKEQLKLTRDKK